MNKLSPAEFLALCKMFSIERAVDMLRPGAWPNFQEVASLAEGLAMECDPDDPKGVARHMRLMCIAQWCEERVK